VKAYQRKQMYSIAPLNENKKRYFLKKKILVSCVAILIFEKYCEISGKQTVSKELLVLTITKITKKN